VGMHGVAHDVTDMALAEEALKQSKENLRLIVDLIPQAIFAKDYNGKFVFANKNFAELYGLTPKQLIDKTIHETMSGDNDPSYFQKQDQEVIETGITKIIPESIFTDYTGKRRIFHSIKVPYILAGKNEKAVLGIAMDITDQKQAEAEKAKIVADIVQRNKDLEQFSYIVSHNLRAPVANIIGLSELLKITKPDAEDNQVMMSELSASVNKLDIVIKDLNYILQIRNQLSEKREPVIFSELLTDIKVSIGNMLNNENVKVIGDFSEINKMFTIKSYLHSIFFNLITNSIKYRQPDVQPAIEITSYRKNNKTGIIFKDNGLGIDLEKKGIYVFGLYKRFHDHTEGKGIGLYMVKTQVETLGGKISIASEVNKGTTFNIVFGTD
jgi:PAS domain S-box-containing protein